MGTRKSDYGTLKESLSRRDLLRAGTFVLPAAALVPGFFSQSARAQTAATFDYYISPTGSDNNAGTQASPWSITAINTKQATYAGKRVGLLDGTYSIRSLIQALPGDGYDTALTIASGTATNVTVIQAVNQGKAVIDCGLPTVNNPAMGYSSSTGQYFTIDGLKFINGGSKIIHCGLYGANYNNQGITIQNCEFTGQNTSGFAAGNNFSCIELQGTLNAVIRNCYTHDNIGNLGPKNGNHFTSFIQWYCHGTLMEFNTFLSPGTCYGKEQGNAGLTFRYNYIDCTGWTESQTLFDFCGETTAATGFNTNIHHNVLVGPTCDLRSHNAGDYFADPVSIYNNTVVILNSSSPTPTGFMADINTGLLTHYNNIIYSQATGDLDLVCMNVEAPGLMDYDLFYSSTGSYVYGYFSAATSQTRNGTSSFSTWKTTMHGSPEAHALNATNPQFVNLGGIGASNYKLQSTSPAINAGRSNGTTGGTACDMGAWGNGAPAIIGSSIPTGGSAPAQQIPQAPSLTVS